MKIKSVLILLFLTVVILNSTFGQLSDYELKYLDDNNLSALKPNLKRIAHFKNGFAQITDKSGKTNYINTQGQKVYSKGEVIAFTQEQGNFPKKYFVFINALKKQGLVDTAGNVVLPARFDGVYLRYLNHGYFVMRINSKQALYNSELKLIIDTLYTDADYFINDSLVVVNSVSYPGGKPFVKKGVLNILTKKEIIPLDNYQDIRSFIWALIGYKDSQFGLFDFSGKTIIPFGAYKSLSPESETQFIHGISEEGFNVMDSVGKVIIPAGNYDYISGYNRAADVFLVRKSNLWGAINIENKIIIPIEYNSLDGFSGDGIARATKDGKTFFLSKKNYRLGDYKFNDYNGFRMYQNNDTIGYVDQSGQVYPFPAYELPDRFFQNEFNLVNTKSGKWGIVNSQFKLIVDTVYDKLITSADGYFTVSKNNKYGVINMQGQVAVPVIYDGLKWIGRSDVEVIIADKKKIISLNR